MKLIKGQALEDLCANIKDCLPPNYTELDIRLGNKGWVEKERSSSQRIHCLNPKDWNSHLKPIDIPNHGYSLPAWRFMLAETVEYFDMPLHVQGIMTLRSWAAKSGLEQSSSLTLKPGWSGYLILELFNSLATYDLLLKPGLAIAQIQFFDIGGEHE